jgi:spore coat polysaccharide biosynthesis protein SpsF
VAVIQARMGSTRLPGKVLERIGDRSLLAWTVDGVRAIPGLAMVVVAESGPHGHLVVFAHGGGGG